MFEMLDKIKALRKQIQEMKAGEPTGSAENVRFFFKAASRTLLTFFNYLF